MTRLASSTPAETASATKKLYIETVGCQMNVLDSEMVVASLRRQGYDLARSVEGADTILFNTCSVRENAEEKVYNSLARLKQLKLDHPDKTIGVMGCMARVQSQIASRFPLQNRWYFAGLGFGFRSQTHRLRGPVPVRHADRLLHGLHGPKCVVPIVTEDLAA